MKKLWILFCFVMAIAIAAGCATTAPEAIESGALTAQATAAPSETQSQTETPAPSPAASQAPYFDIDYSNIGQMASYTPESVLEGFYDGFIRCAPYIKEIEITSGLYSVYGEIMCRIEGISKLELKGIAEDSFGVSMEATDFADGGYFALMEEGVYDVNKICIIAYHDMVYLAIQEADFSMVDGFKLPYYYIERLGENAFNFAPEDSVLDMQRAKFDFVNDSFELSNWYSVPSRDRETIVESFMDEISRMDGYSYRYEEEWDTEYREIRKSDGTVVAIHQNEYDGCMNIGISIQYKELPLFDSAQFDDTRSLQFEDLYNNVCKEILPVLGGEVTEVSLSQSENFQFEMITDLPELMDRTVNNAVITELSITGLDDIDGLLNEGVLAENILGVTGDAEVYSDSWHTVIYKEDAFAIRMYMSQEEDVNNGQPYLVCTIIEINSPLFQTIEALQVLDEIPDLNVAFNNDPAESLLILRASNDETFFKFTKVFFLGNADYDEMVNLYRDYFESTYDDYTFEEMDDGKSIISYDVQSEIIEGIIYTTEVFFGYDGNTIFINVDITERLMDEFED